VGDKAHSLYGMFTYGMPVPMFAMLAIAVQVVAF